MSMNPVQHFLDGLAREQQKDRVVVQALVSKAKMKELKDDLTLTTSEWGAHSEQTPEGYNGHLAGIPVFVSELFFVTEPAPKRGWRRFFHV